VAEEQALRELIAKMEDQEIPLVIADDMGDESMLVLKAPLSTKADSDVVIARFVGHPLYCDENDVVEDTEPKWREAFVGMRHSLALCMRVGRMVIAAHDLWERDEWGPANRAFDSLSEGERRITFADIRRAFEEENRAQANTAAFWHRLEEWWDAQRNHPDEDLGIGEALERAERRPEELRRMVEGSEADE
jgi:hypothetical protein